MYPQRESPWTDPTMDERLRAWWGNKSVIQIGKLLGVSKNSVIGRAHRLNLPRQTNPVKRQGDAPPVRPYAARKAAAAAARAGQRAAARVPRPPEIVPAPVLLSPVHKCQWIKTPDRPWLFCHAPVIQSKPYCPQHYRLAYTAEKAA